MKLELDIENLLKDHKRLTLNSDTLYNKKTIDKKV